MFVNAYTHYRLKKGIFLDFFNMYFIQHCFICSSSDSIVSEGDGIKPRTVATSALTVKRSNHSARPHPLRLDLITDLIFIEDTGIKTNDHIDFSIIMSNCTRPTVECGYLSTDIWPFHQSAFAECTQCRNERPSK